MQIESEAFIIFQKRQLPSAHLIKETSEAKYGLLKKWNERNIKLQEDLFNGLQERDVHSGLMLSVRTFKMQCAFMFGNTPSRHKYYYLEAAVS